MKVTRKIEIDEGTAQVLERRVADRGLSVADLVAELAEFAIESNTDEDLAELDIRWKAAQEPGGRVPHEDVVKWLKTWGSPAYKPWGSSR